MKKTILLLLSSFIIGGCSVIGPFYHSELEDRKTPTDLMPEETAAERSVSYYDQPLIKNVNHYAKWIIQDLLSNFDLPDNRAVFVVTDFALLDSDLRKTNHFGRQLTEAIMHEVNRTGYSVIDMKSSGSIRMSNSGDLFFQTEKLHELATELAATNIISGTMARHRGGYLLNARIVDADSNSLVSSAQIFVPYDIVDGVLLEDQTPATNGIAITPAYVEE